MGSTCSSNSGGFDATLEADDRKGPPQGEKYTFVIVGFGVAGGYAGKQLADLGVADFEVAFIGEESSFAYERPALSKGYLFPPAAPKKPARLPNFHTSVAKGAVPQNEEWYQRKNWTCYLGTKVVSIDGKKKSIRCQGPNGEELVRYEYLIVATGSTANRITVPGSDLKNIYYMRNEQEAATLIRKLERTTGQRFQDRKLAPSKLKSGVLQSTRTFDINEERSFPGVPTYMGQAGEDDDDEKRTDLKRGVVLGGGLLGVELACALVGWTGLDEVCLLYQGKGLYSDLVHWNEEFRAKLQGEIEKRAPNLKQYPDVSIDKILPHKEIGSTVGSVHLTSGLDLDCYFLICAIGAQVCGKELFSKKSVQVDDHLKIQSSEYKDCWAAGELAKEECGVQAAREMGMFAARQAFAAHKNDKQELEKRFAFSPFYYSRLFEYTDDPLIWYQIGDFIASNYSSWKQEKCGMGNSLGGDSASGPFAILYLDSTGIVKGCTICGSAGHIDTLDQVRELIESGSCTLDQVHQEFKNQSYSCE